jgi:hypothetical protein
MEFLCTQLGVLYAEKRGRIFDAVWLANDAGVKSDEIEKKSTASGNVDLQVEGV